MKKIPKPKRKVLDLQIKVGSQISLSMLWYERQPKSVIHKYLQFKRIRGFAAKKKKSKTPTQKKIIDFF